MRRAPRAANHEDVAAGPRRSSRGLPGSRGSTLTARGGGRTRWAAVPRGGAAEHGHPPEALDDDFCVAVRLKVKSKINFYSRIKHRK